MNGSLNLFVEPWVRQLGWVLIHFLWQGAGIALLLAVTLRILARASAHVRYFVIGGSLLLCGVMPAATWMMLEPRTVAPFAPAPMFPETATAPAARGSEVKAVVETASWSMGNAGTGWQERLSRYAETALPYVVGLWFGGVLILTLRLTLGWALMQRLCLTGSPIQHSHCLERFQSLLERMQVDVPVRLLESALIEVPTLIGWLRPTILVPASVLVGLTPDQFEAILAHELAHVRRYDYLLNLFQTVIETILFYHPAVWWISRKLREERENCCDDIALEVMQDRLVYVSALAQLEQRRGLPLALTASGGSLLQRIRRIAGANDRKVSALPLGIMVLILIAVVGISIRTTRADAPAVAITQNANDSASTSLPSLNVNVNVTISLSGKLKDWSKQSTDKYGWGGAPVSHIELAPMEIKFGQQGVTEEIREYPYPIEFEEPKTDVSSTFQGKPVTLVVPMTPREFVTKDVGWSIEVTPDKGENGIVRLKGTATCTTATMENHGAYGENSGPIYRDIKNPQNGKVDYVLLTSNASFMPIFQISVTPFFVFAKPGQSYVVKLQSGTDSIDATIRCDLLGKPDESPGSNRRTR